VRSAVAIDAIQWPPGHAEPRLRARPFAAVAADLDLDCETMPKPALVTELLARCLRTGEQCDQGIGDADDARAAFRQWNVVDRLQGLLAIAYASNGAETAALAHCSDCRGQIELELGLPGFAADSVETVECDSPDGQRIRGRLPTGADLIAWSDEAAGDESWLAQRLVVAIDDLPPAQNWQLPQTWLAPIAEALQAADPLTALKLDVQCPFCACALAVEVDLESLLLTALGRRQRTVIEEVHRLASHYHWNETEIVAMPAWRRRRYLDRIQADFA
jgi:hypothetical protein